MLAVIYVNYDEANEFGENVTLTYLLVVTKANIDL